MRFAGSLIGLTLVSCMAAFAETMPKLDAVVPEPGTIMLMATGLVGGAGYLAWKRRGKK